MQHLRSTSAEPSFEMEKLRACPRREKDKWWTPPGGWGDVGELPSAMVAREVREESGFNGTVRQVGCPIMMPIILNRLNSFTPIN